MVGEQYSGLGKASLPPELLRLPELTDIKLPGHPDRSIDYARNLATDLSIGAGLGPEPSMRALMGRISDAGASYLVSGGSDQRINMWDFQSASRCYNVNGGEKVSYTAASASLFLGIPTPPKPSAHNVSPAMMKGGVRPKSGHEDTILDLKSCERPRALLSAGGDGVIKAWR
jgi:hypothetical protein